MPLFQFKVGVLGAFCLDLETHHEDIKGSFVNLAVNCGTLVGFVLGHTDTGTRMHPKGKKCEFGGLTSVFTLCYFSPLMPTSLLHPKASYKSQCPPERPVHVIYLSLLPWHHTSTKASCHDSNSWQCLHFIADKSLSLQPLTPPLTTIP